MPKSANKLRAHYNPVVRTMLPMCGCAFVDMTAAKILWLWLWHTDKSKEENASDGGDSDDDDDVEKDVDDEDDVLDDESEEYLARLEKARLTTHTAQCWCFHCTVN